MTVTETAIDYPGLLRLLGSMYLDSPSGETITGWRSALAGSVPDGLQSLKESLQAVDLGSPTEVQKLETEFARLFVGPAAVPCPPWESLYTSPDRRMMQAAHDAVLGLHAEAGVMMNAGGVLPDHIGAELRFLALLLDRAGCGANPDEQAALSLADRLLDEHLNRWTARFTEDMERSTDAPLYQTLARATRAVLSLLQQ